MTRNEDLTRRRNNLRKFRVDTRKRIEAAMRIPEVGLRLNRITELKAILRGTEAEWRDLERNIGMERLLSTQPSRPVVRTAPVRRAAMPYLTRMLGR
jgi:hypothetical protein